jgi:NADPH-dependent glutamate synthase beta subunit-like oxidoreductase
MCAAVAQALRSRAPLISLHRRGAKHRLVGRFRYRSRCERLVLTGNQSNSTARPLETSLQGVFAIGDVRSGSVKRVAAAVGEGAQVVTALHDFLAASGREWDVVATH